VSKAIKQNPTGLQINNDVLLNFWNFNHNPDRNWVGIKIEPIVKEVGKPAPTNWY